MKILIADDHLLVLEGLELLLSTFPFVTKISKAIDHHEVKRELEKENYDVILLDIHFGKIDGRELIKDLKVQNQTIKIIALTSQSDGTTIKSSINAGFDGYLLKIDGRAEIENALASVMKGEKYFSPKTQQVFFETQTSNKNIELTERELEILQLIVEEKTTKEIADHLCLSEKTIETHRGNLMLKLEAKNIAGMVRRAIMDGLVKI